MSVEFFHSSCAVALVTVLSCTGEAKAAVDWFTVTNSPRCGADAAVLAQSIDERLSAARDASLAVQLQLLDEASGTAATLRLTRSATVVGFRRLVAPTCEEALEAVVVVTALALSLEPEPHAVQTEASRPEPDSELERVRRMDADPVLAIAPGRASTAGPRFDLGASGARRPVRSRSWALVLGFGADAGTLRDATGIVGVGMGAPLGPGKIRARAWYGLPYRYERDEAGGFESVRADFAAGAVDYCHALGGRWLGACGGLEVLVRRSWLGQGTAEARERRFDAQPAFATVLSGVLVYPDALLQPLLEVGAQVPVVGRRADAPWVTLRASLGAALSF